MEERYIRNIGALSEDDCRLLLEKKILVAGCGGLGGYIIDMLLRVGVGAIIAADGDAFEPSNLNRQLMSDVNSLGKSKAEAAADYARRVNPVVRFRPEPVFIDADNALKLIEGCDAVIDGLDNIRSRRIVAAACGELGIPMIYGAIRGWTAQCGIVLPGDGMIDRLYPDSIDLTDKSSLPCTAALCAAMQTALCIKLLCGKELEPGKLYMADLLDMESIGFLYK